jgi:RNA polymerase sigma-70 factor (ECF subfamily)
MKKPPALTDESLMALIQARDGHGLRLLYDRYFRLLKDVSFAILHNEADTDDLLQDVFLQIWNQAASYTSSKGQPLGWIITLTRRRSIDRLRRRNSYHRAGDRLAEQAEGQSESWTHVHEDAVRSETSEYLRRALAILPEAQRNAIHLAYRRQMSQREIAAYTGIPLGTIKTRLELGLRKLAEFLRGFEDLLSIEHSAAPAVVARSP